MLLKTLDAFWDTFKHILQQEDVIELRWDIHWMMIHFGSIYKNNYFTILNEIIPKLEKIGVENTKLMLEVILNDEFKGVFKMSKDRYERINTCTRLMCYWLHYIDKGNIEYIPEWNQLLNKLQNYRNYSKPLSAEIELMSYGLERALKCKNYKSATNGFKNIINMLIKGVDNECE